MRDAARTNDHLCTICTQKTAFLFAHLIGHDKDTVIALKCSTMGQAMTRIAARRLKDSASRTQEAVLFAVINHSRSNAILHTATRVQHLQLCQHNWLYITGNAMKEQQWRTAYQIKN